MKEGLERRARTQDLCARADGWLRLASLNGMHEDGAQMAANSGMRASCRRFSRNEGTRKVNYNLIDNRLLLPLS